MAYTKEYYEAHKDEIRAKSRAYRRKLYAENPEKVVADNRASRARRRARGKIVDDPEKGRNRQLRRMYGITIVEYRAMEAALGGACASCGVVPETTLHVDHDHATGKVRGLLCHSCNTALGLLKDNAEVIQKLVEYRKSHE